MRCAGETEGRHQDEECGREDGGPRGPRQGAGRGGTGQRGKGGALPPLLALVRPKSPDPAFRPPRVFLALCATLPHGSLLDRVPATAWTSGPRLTACCPLPISRAT